MLCSGAASGALAETPHAASYGPFTIVSDGAGQLSTRAFTIDVRTDGLIEARYVAPASHCSSLKMRFAVDGRVLAITRPLPADGDSGYVFLGRWPSGVHKVELRAEGVPGGCNHGRLLNWSGDASVRTWSIDPPSDARDIELEGPVFESASVNYAWGYVNHGCYVDASGAVYAFAYERGAKPWAPVSTGDGLLSQADLADRYQHGRRSLGRLTPEATAQLAAAASLIDQAARGRITSRSAMADAGEHTLSVLAPVAGRDAYRLIVLSGLGDQTMRNSAAAAARILDRLKALPAFGDCAWR